LTGLPDRRYFEGRLLVALRKARSRADYHFAVLFVDLDGFKVLNDTWGHLHGDRVLQEIAVRLDACIRPGDTVARFGGDEFTMLVDQLHDPSDVVHVAERIQSQMRVPVEIDGHRAAITASIGIALSWHGYRDAEAMLRDADRAMYRAKAEGKARYSIWATEGK
jgi:diguanylate cyclase (GGDEF)-like protein